MDSCSLKRVAASCVAPDTRGALPSRPVEAWRELIHVGVVHDPEGPPRDHPDIIYRECITINLDADTKDNIVPENILLWSKRYCLPIGLHRGWLDFSSTPYGPRLPASAMQPHHFARYGVFVPVEYVDSDRESTSPFPSGKRKRSLEDTSEPATAKRAKNHVRKRPATAQKSQKAVVALDAPRVLRSNKRSQSRRSRPSSRQLGTPHESSRTNRDLDQAEFSHRPSKRKHDGRGEEQQRKRRVVGSSLEEQGDGVRRSARVLGRAVVRVALEDE